MWPEQFILLCDPRADYEYAGRLAREYNFALQIGTPDTLTLPAAYPFVLFLQAHGLCLLNCHKKRQNPVHIDFCAGKKWHRLRYGGGKSQLIAKAFALNKGIKPVIWDLTAGLAHDAFVLASLGASLILFERHPALAALLQDALYRAQRCDPVAPIIQRMQLVHQNSLTLFQNNPGHQNNPGKNNPGHPQKEHNSGHNSGHPQNYPEDNPADNPGHDNPGHPQNYPQNYPAPDMIYLDPMFPHKKGSAAVKKEMQYLQQLVGVLKKEKQLERENQLLLTAACQHARYRVIVKRPIWAPCIAIERKPDLQLQSKKQRFDIYINQGVSAKGK